MGKSSATGSFHLLIGVVGSSVILAVGTLILAALLPVESYGLYYMAMIPASIINFFRDWGINSAMIQKIASLRAAGKNDEIHDVILSGVVFEVVSGVALALISFAVAYPLAVIISPADAPSLSLYIAIMSISIFAGALTAAASSIFVGFERMKLNSLTSVFQATVKTALGPLLIVLGFGVLGAVYAAAASIFIGGLVSILIVYFALFRPLRQCKVGKCDIKKTLKPLLKYGLPLTVSSIVVGVMPLIFSLSMAVYADTWMMGNYSAANNFMVLLTFVSFPVATALFPVFSKLKPETEPSLVKTVFSSSVKYTALILVPATMMIITLATPMVNTLFPQDGIMNALFVANAQPKFPFAPIFLALSAAINLFVLVGNISLGTFQTGIGKTNQVMKQSILSLAVGLPLAYFFVGYMASLGGPYYAVLGGILGTLIASIPGMAWGLIWLWKHYKVKADLGNSAKIFASAAIASVAAFVFINVLSLPYVVILAVGFFVFMVFYLASAPVLGAVNRTDIENFKAMFSGLGIVSKFLDFPLLFMQKFCKIARSEKVLPETRKA